MKIDPICHIEVPEDQTMEAEVTRYVGAERHERNDGRRGYRNGYKPRTMKTRVGELELEVPQVRACEPYRPSMFAKWQRSERTLLVACAEMYFQGFSTRNVRNVLEAMCDGELSSATVTAHAPGPAGARVASPQSPTLRWAG